MQVSVPGGFPPWKKWKKMDGVDVLMLEGKPFGNRKDRRSRPKTPRENRRLQRLMCQG
jgi:hypothetical protein